MLCGHSFKQMGMRWSDSLWKFGSVFNLLHIQSADGVDKGHGFVFRAYLLQVCKVLTCNRSQRYRIVQKKKRRRRMHTDEYPDLH